MKNNKGRKTDIINLVSEGYTAAEIGQKLEISPRTVEKYIESWKTELHAKNIPHLISIAFREGVIK